jgi:hypothetical protein
MSDSRYFAELAGSHPDRHRRATQTSARKSRERAAERESMLERIIELSGVKIEVLVSRIYAFKGENYPDAKGVTPAMVRQYLANEHWVRDTEAVVKYLYAEVCSYASKAGWKHRKEWEGKQAEKDEVRVPLLAETGARVKLSHTAFRAKSAERAQKNKAERAAKEIENKKKAAALADFKEKQGSLL